MASELHNKPHRGYVLPPKARVDKMLYDDLSKNARQNIIKRLTVPKMSGKAWQVLEGQVCRIVVSHGPQVGDVNMWNLNDHNERFYTGKTRQIHRTHLTTYDRLWSSMPYLRPMATISADSMKYGFDEDGMSVHDVIGTRCDPYIQHMLTGKKDLPSCHQNLTDAIKPWGLSETDVHDVFNIFMCSGFDKKSHEYMIKASPVKKGDYIEFVAEMDLLVALSACPQGDVSIAVGDQGSNAICFPLDVEIGQPKEDLLAQWRNAKYV